MKAAVHRRFGAPEVVTVDEIPMPVPRADQVLVRVHASTVSIADHRARAKDLPRGLGALGAVMFGVIRPTKPVLGMDFAGEIAQLGSAVTNFAVGDHVFGMSGSSFGGHAEYLVVKATGAIARAPKNLTLTEAAALPFGGTTALAFMRGVRSGDRMLVNGASSATGVMAVQIAAARGAHVTGVSSAGNHALVTSLGAERVIDYATDDFSDADSTYDVVMDCVGNAPFRRIDRCLKPGGAYLPVVSDLPGMLFDAGRARRAGKTSVPSMLTITAADLEELALLAETGAVRPVIDSTVDLDGIVAGHRRVETHRKRGAVVVQIA
jgi:NADPH:quinone reductase-like Zn-dependent oxidoreductase